MASRTWIAVALSLVIWFVYLKWFGPPPVQYDHSGKPVASAPQQTGGTAAAPSGASSFVPPQAAASLSPAIPSGKLEVSFQEQGGKVGRVAVTTYHEKVDNHSPFITPVDPAQSGASLGTVFTDPKLTSFSHGAYTQTKVGETVRFHRQADELEVTKDYRLGTGTYALESTVKIRLNASEKRDWGYVYIPVGAKDLTHSDTDPMHAWEVVTYVDEKISRDLVAKLKETDRVIQGHVQWLAFGNRYFSTAILNQGSLNPDVVFAKTKDFSGGYLRYPLQLKDGQNEVEVKVTYYVGPKDYSELSKYPGMKQLIDYGTFSWLAYLMLEVLRFFYGVVHNYGVAIILLTVLVRGLLYPLSLKSYKSMKAMQKLQPQIAALKERHKEDPQRFNQEQIAQFKAHKVNPMGGCLPMLVQLPVFIALYSLLGNSIELFHAPFFGWIHDLSSKDPYYVFPILMGLSMLVQQKLTPTPGMDPVQVKMMYIMPVVFTFIMLNLPSGLTIYIFLSTLLGIIQQLVMNREPGSSSMKLAAAPQSSGK